MYLCHSRLYYLFANIVYIIYNCYIDIIIMTDDDVNSSYYSVLCYAIGPSARLGGSTTIVSAPVVPGVELAGGI